MPYKINETLLSKHDIGIGSFYFYNNLLISEINEGVTMSVDNTKELYKLIDKYYGKSTPFVYIANRIHSYSFEPTGHYDFEKTFPNAKALAVVVYDKINTRAAEFEKVFVGPPMAIFNNVDKAIDWIQQYIPKD
ncbi:hypothetical protein [Aquimarina brevivitae]|uniref:SpoIIAA-like protein n=1 Tax=Aquimarina brevivitae TaxID=323412 RepID=A0A4Q7PI60_9FLAO|nr:hypothetical protein [Aquimarina brevivitae]RZT00292.1 hypothetical protein EV197_1528 [Aquimarina brevivitae]